MTDNISAVTIHLTAEDHASAIVDNLRRSVERLQRSMVRSFKPAFAAGGLTDFDQGKRIAARDRKGTRDQVRAFKAVTDKIRFQSRMYAQAERQERQAERARQQAEAANLRAFRQRLAFGERMRRQRADEERQGEREHLSRVRRLEREHRIARQGFLSSGSRTFSSGHDAVDRFTRTPARAAAVGGAVAGVAARRILTVESDVDAAEINTRAYGGLSKEAARALRQQWAGPLAEQLGSTTSKMLTAFTDALKIGIPEEGAKAFTGLAVKTSEAWGVQFEEVSDVLGTINSLITADGSPFDFEKLKSVANAMQFLSAKMSTTPERMISFMRRGAGASQLLGMSQEAGLAFGAASTSLGNEAGASGRMFDYVAGRLISLPKIMRGQGEEARSAKRLVASLGYNGIADLQRQQRDNPNEFVFDFIERFQKIKDQKKRNEAIRWFTGQEWLGEFGRMVTGIAKVREAQKLSQNAGGVDAIGDVWALHSQKLAFIFKQFKAGFLNVLGEFGMVLSPIAAEVSKRFLAWAQSLQGGGLRERFQAAIDGFIKGLGFDSLGDALDKAFSGAGGGWSAESVGRFARGFAAGIREVASAIAAGIGALSGGAFDPEIIGLLAARIIGFSVALKAASPIIDILKGIGSAFVAVAAALATAWTSVRLIRTFVGGSAAGAGGLGAALFSGIIGSIGLLFGAAAISQYQAAIAAFLVEKTRDVISFIADEIKKAFRELPSVLASQFGITNPSQFWVQPPTGSPQAGQGQRPPWQQGHALDLMFPGFASGGYVSGPGTGTSDSILAYLSNGEFVMSADATRRNRPLLEALNNGRAIPRFARGGGVGRGGYGELSGISFAHGEEIVMSLHRLVDLIRRGTDQFRIAAIGSFRPGGTGASPGSASSSGGNSSSGPAQFVRPNFNPPSWMGTGQGRNGAGSGAAPGIGGARGAGAGIGGSRSWRNNNPGNIEYGAFARSMGATGSDGRFAIFPDYAAGRRAQEKLLFESNGYRNLTLGQAIRRWAPASENNVPAYIRAMGGDPGKRMSEYTPEERARLLDAMQRHEGWRPGTRTASTNPGQQIAQGMREVAGGAHPLGGAGRVSSQFGMRQHPFLGRNILHAGIDLAAPGGTPVQAMKAGTASINRHGDVTVRHPDGTSTVYRHMIPSVGEGAQIGAGQNIGQLKHSDPGRSTGPHLHFESRGADGQPIDPRPLLAPRVTPRANGIETPESISRSVPVTPSGSGAGAALGGSGVSVAARPVNVTMTVNGANQSPDQLASLLQRRYRKL